MTSPVDYADIQGLVRFAYKRMTEACYLLIRIKDRSVARSWLSNAPATSAIELERPPQTALQVAFTRSGLEAIGARAQTIAGFSAEFIAGMAGDENRSRRLGDIGDNAPSSWNWGSPEKIPHAVLMLFAEPGLLDSWRHSVAGKAWADAFEEIDCLPTSNMDGREPFGFIDGISQPKLDWERARTVPANGNERDYSNAVCLGEFLLGYRNEYGRYTDRPLLDAQDPATAELVFAEDQPGKKDLGRNGTYVVMRQLAQDVRGFWQFLDKATHSNPERRYRLGSAMVGRQYADGSPLVPLSQNAIDGITSEAEELTNNLFTYESDPEGTKCPYGAHIRRANPRTADIPGHPKGLLSTLIHALGFGTEHIRDDLISSARFHRILRRGREYGPNLSDEEALNPAPPDDPERGLQFLAINANIQRQFEFVQNAWLMGAKFAGLTEESDPLLGNRAPVQGCPYTNAFSVPRVGEVRQRITGLPRFITVRGGAYFFLPSIRALRYLSRLTN
jgi:Dyp-type peroxidase family